MIELFAVLLLFLPGIPLAYLICRRLGISLSKIELSLFGCIFWNFVFLTLSALTGLFGQAKVFFSSFTLASCIILIAWAIIAVKYATAKDRKTMLPTIAGFLRRNFYIELAFVVVFTFYVSITIFHSLYVEWDAVSIYLLTGKSIALTGSVPLNIFRQSTNDFFLAPGMSLMSAWNYFTLNEPPRLIPLIWLSLGAFAIYDLCRIKLTKNLSFVAVFSFMLFPVTIDYMANSSLYIDLPTILYVLISFLFIIKGLQSGRLLFFVSSLMAISIGVMMKPYAVAFLPLILGFVFLAIFKKIKAVHKYLLFIPFALSIFVFQWFWDVLFYSTSSPNYVSKLYRILPVLFLLPLMLLLVKTIDVKSVNRHKLSSIGLLACSLAPIVLVFGFELFSNHTVFGWGPGASGVLKLYQSITSTSSSASVNLLTSISWQPMFLSLALGAPLIIPLLVGLLRVGLNRKYVFSSVLLLWLCVSLLTWSFFFSNSFEGSEYRRLLYLAPIASTLIALGFSYFINKFRLDPDVAFKLFISYAALVTIYLWNFYFSSSLLNSLAAETSISSIVGSEIYSAFLVSFLLLLGVAYYLSRHKIAVRFVRGKISVSMQKVISGILVVILLCLAISTSVIYAVEGVSKQGYSVDDYMSAPPPLSWLGNNIREVIDYYNTYNLKEATTIGFRVNYLPYYANVTVIDMSQVWSYSYIEPILKENNEAAILNLLYNQNITYFLIPTSSNANPSSYSSYQRALNFTLFKMITANTRFFVVKEFSDFTLYKLLSVAEYTDYHNKLKDNFYSENDPLVLSDDNQSDQYTANFQDIVTLSNDGSSKIVGSDSLKILLSSYKVEKDIVVRKDFSEPINASGYDYISYFFYGEHTGETYSIRLVSSYPGSQLTYQFTDSWNGWARVIMPLNEFTVLNGEPDLSNISCFALVITQKENSNSHSIGLDRVILDSDNPTATFKTLPLFLLES